MFGDEDPKILQKIKEGRQRDGNNLALYLIDLHNMKRNVEVMIKRKDPRGKLWMKLIKQDIKDAEKKLEKLRGESIQEGRWKGTEEELHDYLLYIKKYKPELFSNVKKNRDIKKLLKKFESVEEGGKGSGRKKGSKNKDDDEKWKGLGYDSFESVKEYIDKFQCPKCEGNGCDHCNGKGYHIKERMGMDPDKARLSMLKIYGSSMVQNFKTILSKLDRGKAIKREWKAFKGIVDLIEKKVEEVL
tara:strand:- start:315 stop:1046 length:732 start_codon:yes stop_codon:yes gene_type:complete